MCHLVDIPPHQHGAVLHLPLSYNPVFDWVCVVKMDSVLLKIQCKTIETKVSTYQLWSCTVNLLRSVSPYHNKADHIRKHELWKVSVTVIYCSHRDAVASFCDLFMAF